MQRLLLESKNKSSNIIKYVEENEDGPLYYVCATGYTLVSSTTTQLVIDSGTSKHFTDTHSDFTQLKQWRDIKTIKIANSNTTEAIEYGTIRVG